MTSFLIIAAFVGGVYFGWWLKDHQPVKEEPKEEREEISMDMARQWANIMTYDGTERGQIGRGDEDDDDT